MLDDWHQAASVADEARYFGHFAPQGVFMGTDATERWTVAQFREWAQPQFKRKSAWSFTRRAPGTSNSRPDGKAAWFDEMLDTPNLGPMPPDRASSFGWAASGRSHNTTFRSRFRMLWRELLSRRLAGTLGAGAELQFRPRPADRISGCILEMMISLRKHIDDYKGGNRLTRVSLKALYRNSGATLLAIGQCAGRAVPGLGVELNQENDGSAARSGAACHCQPA